MTLKCELQIIISGIGDHSAEDIIKAAAHHIRESQKTSGNTKKSEFSKEQEAKNLTDFYIKDFFLNDFLGLVIICKTYFTAIQL